MAKIEIEESELAALRRVQTFADKALSNPKTRTAFLGISKTLDPNVAIPELDATASVMEAMKPLQEKIDALGKKFEEIQTTSVNTENENKVKSRVEAGRKMLTDNGYNAEGIEKVEKLMLEEGISSYAGGLALFERQNPPSAPADETTSRWGAHLPTDIETAPDYQSLWASQGRDDAWVEKSLRGTRWGRH